VTTEIIVIVKNENAGARAHGTAIEPGRGQSADSGPDYEKIVGLFFGRHVRARERGAPARECMGDFERSRVLTAQAGQGRRITLRIRGDLLGRAQAGRNRQHHAIEEVPAGDAVHERTLQYGRRNPISTPSLPRRPGPPCARDLIFSAINTWAHARK